MTSPGPHQDLDELTRYSDADPRSVACPVCHVSPKRSCVDPPGAPPSKSRPGSWDHTARAILAAAGPPAVDDLVAAELLGVPGEEAPKVELANIRRLLQKHGVAPADGNGVLRSTVAMVEEALIRRPPA